MRGHLAAARLVIFAEYVTDAGYDPDYDHIVPAVGASAAPDFTFYNLYSTAPVTLSGAALPATRRACNRTLLQGGCAPAGVDYGVAVTGVASGGARGGAPPGAPRGQPRLRAQHERRPGWSAPGGAGKAARGSCYRCGGQGHWAQDCTAGTAGGTGTGSAGGGGGGGGPGARAAPPASPPLPAAPS
jgi:hypothetical protein